MEAYLYIDIYLIIEYHHLLVPTLHTQHFFPYDTTYVVLRKQIIDVAMMIYLWTRLHWYSLKIIIHLSLGNDNYLDESWKKVEEDASNLLFNNAYDVTVDKSIFRVICDSVESVESVE